MAESSSLKEKEDQKNALLWYTIEVYARWFELETTWAKMQKIKVIFTHSKLSHRVCMRKKIRKKRNHCRNSRKKSQRFSSRTDVLSSHLSELSAIRERISPR